MTHERPPGDEPEGDEPLVAGLRRSDEEAFELLVRRYAPRIRRWIACHVHDPAEVEDLTQEVLLSAWRAGPRLRSDTVLPAWLKTIAVNACRKRARRSLRKPAVPAGLTPDRTPSHDPPDVAESLDVASALRQLPEREGRVLRLLYRDELSIRQAAAALDVSADAAKSLAARARRRFRSRFTTWFGRAAGGAVVVPLREVRDLWSSLGSWFRSALAAGTAAATASASLAVTVGPPQPTPPPTPPAQAAAPASAEEESTAPSLAEPAQAADTTSADDPAPADAAGATDAPTDAPSEPSTAEAGTEGAGTTSASHHDDPGSRVGTVGAGEEECRTDGDDENGDPGRDEEEERCEDGDPTPPPNSPGPAPGPTPGDPGRVRAPLGPPTP